MYFLGVFYKGLATTPRWARSVIPGFDRRRADENSEARKRDFDLSFKLQHPAGPQGRGLLRWI